jgi:hypothetical protein
VPVVGGLAGPSGPDGTALAPLHRICIDHDIGRDIGRDIGATLALWMLFWVLVGPERRPELKRVFEESAPWVFRDNP